MSACDDADPDTLISHLAGPLSPSGCTAFRSAAEDALTRVPRWGVALARSRRLNGENAQLGNAELNECR